MINKSRLSLADMIKITAFYLLMISIDVNAKGKPKINIHPIAIDDGELTLNSEINTYRGTIYNNSTLTYSAKNGIDIGISSQNIPLSGGGAQNYQDDTYINLSYSRNFSSHNLTVGYQNISRRLPKLYKQLLPYLQYLKVHIDKKYQRKLLDKFLPHHPLD